MFKKLKLTTKLTLVISAVVMVVFAVLITITVVTSRASIYTGISGELASIAEFNGGEIQSGFDTVERAALGIQDYIGRLYSGQVTEEGDADLQQSTLYPGRALTSAAYNLEQFVVETARNTVKNTPEIKMLGVMLSPTSFRAIWKNTDFTSPWIQRILPFISMTPTRDMRKRTPTAFPLERDIPTSPSPIRMEMAWWWPMARLSPTGDGS